MDQPYALTHHARKRIADMGLEPDEVEQAFTRPEKTWPDRKYGTQMRTRGRVTLSVGEGQDRPVVVTVLWADDDLWRASYRAGETAGRAPRF